MKPSYSLKGIPKYIQISESVVHSIKQGTIKKNHLLPTINELSAMLNISRDTAERGYRELKRKGIVESVPGKGYFIANTRHEKPVRVIFFFNAFNESNQMIYRSFAEALGNYVDVEYCVYNNDYYLFQKLLQEKKGRNCWYVIIPDFGNHEKKAGKLISTLAKNRLVVLDKKIPGVDNKFTELYLKILKLAGTAQFKNN
jgi:DNA-binding transcriptional regulator YhcF (GntR family)